VLTRRTLFWSVVAGLAIANAAAFISTLSVLNMEEHARQSSSLPGVGSFLFCFVVQRHLSIPRQWFWSIAVVNFTLFTLALWLMIAGDAHDVPLTREHLIDAFPNLIGLAPLWVISQATLALMLLSFWLAGRRLGLR
jgi:hypothetical protein